jgi:hypothetical protein
MLVTSWLSSSAFAVCWWCIEYKLRTRGEHEMIMITLLSLVGTAVVYNMCHRDTVQYARDIGINNGKKALEIVKCQPLATYAGVVTTTTCGYAV